MGVKRRNVYKRSDRYTYDYNIDIQDERWINKSLLLRKNADYTCERCGVRGRVVVHHSYYLDGLHLWEYPKDALKVLCLKCHEIEHDKEINPCDKVVEAINRGITKGAIIDCLDSLIDENGIYIPKGAIIPSKKGVKKNVENTSLLEAFLHEVNQYSKEYDENYISSFINYYSQKNSKGEFLFEPLDLFSYKERLQQWESRFLDNMSSEAERQAGLNWYEYFRKMHGIIKDSFEKNREFLDECYCSLDKKYSERTDLNGMVMRDIIPNFQNKKSTLKAFVDKRGLPNVFIELFRSSVLDEIQEVNSKGSKSVCIWKEKRYVDTNASLNLERIRTIENYIGVKIFWQPCIFRDIHYCMDNVSYVKRFVLKKMAEYNGGINYYIEKWLPQFESVNSYGKLPFVKPNISIGDFKFVYLLNTMLRKNSANIISRIKTMNANILLDDFCKENGIKILDIKGGKTLKEYLEEKIKVFDAEISFQPIIIEVEDTFLNFYNHDLDIPQDLLQTLNEKLGFCFILFKLNVFHKIHKYTKFTRKAGGYSISNDIFFQVKWTPPFDILTAMEGTEFDFSCERFIKAKMKFISLPKEDDLYGDLYKCLSLLEEKIAYKENIEVEKWKKEYENNNSWELREL